MHVAGEAKVGVHVRVGLADHEQNAEHDSEQQARVEAPTVAVEKGVVRPGDAMPDASKMSVLRSGSPQGLKDVSAGLGVGGQRPPARSGR